MTIVDYGLKLKEGVVLKVANTKETEWMLQGELRAIYGGQLVYGEKFSEDGQQ